MDKSYVTLVIDLLKTADYYGESKLIDIAKGKNKIALNFKEMRNSMIRNKI